MFLQVWCITYIEALVLITEVKPSVMVLVHVESIALGSVISCASGAKLILWFALAAPMENNVAVDWTTEFVFFGTTTTLRR